MFAISSATVQLIKYKHARLIFQIDEVLEKVEMSVKGSRPEQPR